MRAPVAVLAAILLVAFNLRVALVLIGPLLEDMRADLGMSRAVAGLLTTIPVCCMGLFGLSARAGIRRLGQGGLITGCLLGLIAAGVLRAVAPSTLWVLVATVPLGVSIALLGATLPSVVKREFPARGGAVTGAYVAALNIGIAAATFTAVPLDRMFGGWRAVSALGALPALLALPLWIATQGRGARRTEAAAVRLRRPSGDALWLGVMFAAQSFGFTAVIAWLPTIYRDAGWTPGGAAATLGLLAIIGIPAAILVPRWSEGRDRRGWIAGASVALAAGSAGVGLAPDSLPWLWLTLFALGSGAVFPLCLTLPLDIGRDTEEVAELVAWMLSIGYLLSALGPVTVGALRDATGSFALPMAVVGAITLAPAFLGRRWGPREGPYSTESPILSP